MYTPLDLVVLRVRLGKLSQKAFGEILGCKQQQVGRWERGRKIPGKYIEKIKELEAGLQQEKKQD